MTLKATICAVTVVPISAPRMTPIACDSDIKPAVTKPTSMTVVTEEDWMIAVTKAPVSRPMIRLVVSLPKIAFMRLPATLFSASAICSMPKRKTARPPKSCIPMPHQSMASWAPVAARTVPAANQAMVPQIRKMADPCHEGRIELKRFSAANMA